MDTTKTYKKEDSVYALVGLLESLSVIPYFPRLGSISTVNMKDFCLRFDVPIEFN